MKCPKCKTEITEDTDFCVICGAKLTDLTIEESETVEPRPRKKRELHKLNRHNLKKKLKVAAVVAAGLAIAVLIIVVVSSLRTSEGRRIADNVPLGRDIEMVNKDTGVVFLRNAGNAVLPEIGTFSYIYEAEDTITVDGIKLPDWCIMLSENSEGLIYKVTYYDFTMLRGSWKGQKSNNLPDTEAVEYGSKIAEAQKILGLRPYAIVTTNDDNTQKLVYRTHSEDENGNVCVYDINLFVNEADGTVRDISMTELDYISFYFSVN
jgi:hypothetical protein